MQKRYFSPPSDTVVTDYIGNMIYVDGALEYILTSEGKIVPFVMMFNATLGGENKVLYNGKELQDEMLGSVNLD